MNTRTCTKIKSIGIAAAMAFPAVATAATADSLSADEVRAIVADVVSDAQSRSSLLQSGGNAGHDGKFFLADADGNFRLNVQGLVQFRYHASFFGSDHTLNNNDDHEGGFSVSRGRVWFNGHAGDPKLKYSVMLTSYDNATPRLDDAYVSYSWDNGWAIRAGQFRTAFMLVRYLGVTKSLSIDRPLTTLFFDQNWSQAVELKYQDDDFRFIFTVSDGLRSVNTDFNADPADVAFTGRFDWKIDGTWGQLGDYTGPRGQEFAAQLGGAVHYETASNDIAGAADDQDLFAWTAELLLEGDGWNFSVQGVGHHISDVQGTGSDFDDYGFLAQGGVYISDKHELFARYSYISPDENRVADEDFTELVFGMNYYIRGHAVKFTLEAHYYLDETTNTRAGRPVPGSGLTGNAPTSNLYSLLASDGEDQFAIIAQIQLAF